MYWYDFDFFSSICPIQCFVSALCTKLLCLWIAPPWPYLTDLLFNVLFNLFNVWFDVKSNVIPTFNQCPHKLSLLTPQHSPGRPADVCRDIFGISSEYLRNIVFAVHFAPHVSENSWFSQKIFLNSFGASSVRFFGSWALALLHLTTWLWFDESPLIVTGFEFCFTWGKVFFRAGQFWLCERRVRITSMPSAVVVISVTFGPGEVGLRGVFGPKPNILRKKPSTKLNKNITAVLNSKKRRMNRAMVLWFFANLRS